MAKDPKLPDCSGPMYKHLGHMAQEQYLRAGHNTMKETPEEKAAREAAEAEQFSKSHSILGRRDLERKAGGGESPSQPTEQPQEGEGWLKKFRRAVRY